MEENYSFWKVWKIFWPYEEEEEKKIDNKTYNLYHGSCGKVVRWRKWSGKWIVEASYFHKK